MTTNKFSFSGALAVFSILTVALAATVAQPLHWRIAGANPKNRPLIEEAARKVEGVESAKVNLQSGFLTVVPKSNGHIDQEDLQAQVEKIGNVSLLIKEYPQHPDKNSLPVIHGKAASPRDPDPSTGKKTGPKSGTQLPTEIQD